MKSTIRKIAGMCLVEMDFQLSASDVIFFRLKGWVTDILDFSE